MSVWAMIATKKTPTLSPYVADVKLTLPNIYQGCTDLCALFFYKSLLPENKQIADFVLLNLCYSTIFLQTGLQTGNNYTYCKVTVLVVIFTFRGMNIGIFSIKNSKWG